jgi:phosphohistidine phosphatase SixA
MRYAIRILFVGFAILGVSLPQVTTAQLSGKALTDALRTGGYVLFFRHGNTRGEPADQDMLNLADCSTQRNLSTQGRNESLLVGWAFRVLRIPVGRVLSSPYCRTMDTARLMFGQAEPTSDLISSFAESGETEQRKLSEALFNLLATAPEPGSNTVLVSHQFNLLRATNLSLDEGEAAIYKPDGLGGYQLVTHVPVRMWLQLAQGELSFWDTIL